MSDQWKKNIDKGQKAVEQLRKEKFNAVQEEKDKKRLAKVEELGRRFRCYICDRPAREPLNSESYNTTDWGYDVSIETLWNLPGDLQNCKVCHRWVCNDHIYGGICQTCGQDAGMVEQFLLGSYEENEWLTRGLHSSKVEKGWIERFLDWLSRL